MNKSKNKKKSFYPTFLVSSLFIAVVGLGVLYFLSRYQGNSLEDLKAWHPGTYWLIHPIARQVKLWALFFSCSLIFSNLIYYRNPILNSEGFKHLLIPIRKGALHFKTILKKALIYVGIFLLLLGLGELFLRGIGYHPGVLSNANWFRPVKKLKLYNSLVADSTGITKAPEGAIEYTQNEINDYLTKGKKRILITKPRLLRGHPYRISHEYIKLFSDGSNHPFRPFMETIKQDDDFELSSEEQLIREYIRQPLNENGFRSVGFDFKKDGRKSVLLLGDSFTYGLSASPIYNSFADRLLSKGYLVYNTGMSGTSPAHYAEIAKQYVGKLQPDYVIVNFYLGNDVQYYDYPLQPFVPAILSTNSGKFTTNFDGISFDNPEDIYAINMKFVEVPGQNTWWGGLLGKTVLGTFTLNFLHQNTNILLEYPPEVDAFVKQIRAIAKPYPNANKFCQEIKAVSEEHQATFLLAIIPDLQQDTLTTVSDYPNLFDSLTYHIPTSIAPKDYNHKDAHFNNEGHRKYADFLMELIRNEEKK